MMTLLVVILVGMVSVAQAEQVGDMDGDGQVDTTEAIISLKVAAGQNPGVPLGTYIPATGNATTLDVLADKSFSNATAADP